MAEEDEVEEGRADDDDRRRENGMDVDETAYEFDNEEEARAIELERRRRLKEAQMYRPTQERG